MPRRTARIIFRKVQDLPNEIGLRFTIDNGIPFSTGFTIIDTKDFRVLKPDDILPDILPHLTEVDISKL